MSDRPVKTVGDYVTLRRGTTYRGDLVGKPGPALLGLGSIVPGGGFRADHWKTFGGECPAKLTLGPGDIYVALKGNTTDGSMIGSVARVPRDMASGRLTQDTAKLELSSPDPEFADYLYWLLRTPQYRHYCGGRATGTTAVGLSRDDFLAYPVPPATRGSRHLVALFEAIEAKIELNRRINRTLESLARATFKSWFVDFDPVRKKMEGKTGGELGLPPSLAALFPPAFDESELGPIPQGWRTGVCSDSFAITMGQSPPGDTYNEARVGLPFYQGRRDFGERFPARRVYCVDPSRLARRGDTLVSVRAPVGDVNIATEDCCIGRGVAGVRHTSGAPLFTYEAMRALRFQFEDFEAGGTVFGSIGGKESETCRSWPRLSSSSKGMREPWPRSVTPWSWPTGAAAHWPFFAIPSCLS